MLAGATLQHGNALGSHPQGLAFEQCYTLLERLRSGSFGTVYTTRLIPPPLETSETNDSDSDDDTPPPLDKTIYACKVIDRTKLKPEADKTVFQELDILRDIRDLDNITQLKDCFVTPTTVYVIQTYCRGGDVFEKLSHKTTYTEHDARDLAKTLLEVMELLHLRKLAHRDLKPENLLLKSRMHASQIVVADFGMSKYVPYDGFLKTRCGTPAFCAPEVIAGLPYNTQVDMWSIGTLLYMLLGGHPPFVDPSFKGLFRKIQAADYDFKSKSFDNVSVEAKRCLASLLRVDPYYRATASQALRSNWWELDDNELSNIDLTTSVREMKTWVAKRKFKGAVSAVMIKNHFSRFIATDKASLLQKVQAWDAATAGKEVEAKNAPLISQWRGKSSFEDLYELQDLIAKGKTSSVFKCTKKPEESWVPSSAKILSAEPTKPIQLAVKRVPRNQGTEDQMVLHEVAVMQNLQHSGLVQILDFLEDESYYYLVMEYVPGGSIMEHLMQRQSFTEADARSIVKTILETVAYIHQEGVVHRDITLENLLLTEQKGVKLCDFGLARKVVAPRSVTRCCGTPLYMAPEVLKHIPYDQSADLWSVGILTYMLLTGVPPFAGGTEAELYAKIRSGEYRFPPSLMISDSAKAVIRKLLVVEPLQRWTAEEALRSSWFQQEASSLSNIDLATSVVKLKDLRSKFRSVAKAVMKLTPDQDSLCIAKGSSPRKTAEERDKVGTLPLFSSDGHEQKEDPILDNEALGLPKSQTDSVKLLV